MRWCKMQQTRTRVEASDRLRRYPGNTGAIHRISRSTSGIPPTSTPRKRVVPLLLFAFRLGDCDRSLRPRRTIRQQDFTFARRLMPKEPLIETAQSAEFSRLAEAREKEVPWRLWGPYLSER